MTDDRATPPSSSETPLAPGDAWLTTEEAAAEFGFHVETLRRWIREGVLEASRVPRRRRWKVRRSDMARLVEDQEGTRTRSSEPARSRVETAAERTIIIGQ